MNQVPKTSSRSSLKSKSSRSSRKLEPGTAINDIVKKDMDGTKVRYLVIQRVVYNNCVYAGSLYSLKSMKMYPKWHPRMLQLAHQRVPVNPPSNPSPVKLHLSHSEEHKFLKRY